MKKNLKSERKTENTKNIYILKYTENIKEKLCKLKTGKRKKKKLKTIKEKLKMHHQEQINNKRMYILNIFIH